MLKASQRLLDERKKKRYSLEKISNATKIRVEFLSSIEKGEYQKLPSAYAQGFVRNYAKFLELPEKEILPLFKREFDERKEYEVLPKGLIGKKDAPLRRFKIKRFFVLGILIFIILIGYILFQGRYAFLNPPLDVDSPSEGQTIFSSIITVSGKTDSSSTIFIGDDAVSVGEDGKFKKEILALPGKTTINVKAVNRFGRETDVTRRVLVK